MRLIDRTLETGNPMYHHSEGWQWCRQYITDPQCSMAQECIVNYKQDWPPGEGLRAEYITFQLIKADGQKTKIWKLDLDEFEGKESSLLNQLLWDLSDTEVRTEDPNLFPPERP